MFCVWCNKELEGRQTKYCCRGCKEKHVVVLKRVVHLKGMSGPNNPTWKGGHKHWSPGRFGRDNGGLSWKTQRRLAWERDDFTCQQCHEKKNRKPDVHHIVPWMNSHSHALDNLICLCQSCHLKEEAKVHEKWGGQLSHYEPKRCECGRPTRLDKCCKCRCKENRNKIKRTPRNSPIKKKMYQPKKSKRLTCPFCGELTLKVFKIGCFSCLRVWVKQQLSLRTTRNLAEEIGCSQMTVVKWSHYGRLAE